MSITQFPMVQELASLIEDNLKSKHLVLAVEDALVTYLQDETSSVGIIKLQPMNSYHRLLMHRLAEIFGFSHESVGEGVDRHLVLERIPETSIPSILVSDILDEHDAFRSPALPLKILKQPDGSIVLKIEVTMEEREEACFAGSEVEELAFLIKDNLQSKHLVLAVEDALVTYLQDESSSIEIVELQPMSSYHRHLVHRLAEIFGFAHESFGEGDDRHLVLERFPKTSIPSVLVSDILNEHDAFQSPATPLQILKRPDGSTVLKIEVSSPSITLEEREEAYLAARERIFSTYEGGPSEAKRQKPKHDPVVARRMIAHALGQRIDMYSSVVGNASTEMPGKDHVQMEDSQATINSSTDENCGEKLASDLKCGKSFDGEECKKGSGVESSEVGSRSNLRGDMRKENLGAAKRMFAHALGIPSTRKVV